MRPYTLALLALLIAGNTAVGQMPVDSVIFRPGAGLEPGQRIRISLLGNRWVGELRRVGGDTVFFGSAEQPMGVRFNAIDTLWRRGSYESMASNIGMVTVGLIGIAAVGAALVGASESGSRMSGEEYGALALGGLAGAAVGWFTGAIIGSSITRWRRLYPRS